MATKRMLIDSSHPEETRVVVISGKKLEDFDVEVQSRKQLKGNIYLAKITRVEPSLQAAFINYGGNRHGFLAFSEIHPDYYQIPVADKEVLLADEKLVTNDLNDIESSGDEDTVEVLGGDLSEEVEQRRPRPNQKNYKIQEVIKRNQVLLVQVVKEERGTKGAALSTYLSLAGRYCVLMPNTARGGGISRKINKVTDRKRLKSIVGDLGIPESMAVIIRTAGSKRSKVEIKRDYEYTTRIWSTVRELTLESIAPSLVHEEGNLIKRSIRDLYDKDLEEVIVAGDDGYRMAKDFMKLLIPSHTKKVQPYSDANIPLMQRYQVEAQLDAIHSPEVFLKSGGYIVINPTEALVSIDVNSGKATKERNIEETALKTNLEAAVEIACQLRLRDLSGLIVIDFIDMEFSRNQHKVERQIKDAMQNDRARIQIGRISPFGLLELSRQRLRPSLIETSSEPCPHCNGSGVVRSIESTAVHILRVIEEECSQDTATSLTIYVPTSIALYLFNNKRQVLADIETRYKTSIFLENDDTLIPPDHRIGDRPQNELTKNQNSDLESTNTARDVTKKRRRRRNRRNSIGESENENFEDSNSDSLIVEDVKASTLQNQEIKSVEFDENLEDSPKRRRRGRRGGRRKVKNSDIEATESNLENTTIAHTEKSAEPPINVVETKIQKTKNHTKKKRLEKIEISEENQNDRHIETVKDTESLSTGEMKLHATQEPKIRRRSSRKKKELVEESVVAAEIDNGGPSTKEDISSKEKIIVKKPRQNNRKIVKKDQIDQDLVGEKLKPSSPKVSAVQPIQKSLEGEIKASEKTTVINIEDTEKSDAPVKSGWWRR